MYFTGNIDITKNILKQSYKALSNRDSLKQTRRIGIGMVQPIHGRDYHKEKKTPDSRQTEDNK